MKLYKSKEGQSVQVRLEGEGTKAEKLGRGARQGCCMTPILFDTYRHRLIEEALEGIEEHTDYVKVGGEKIKAIEYLDPYFYPGLVLG